MVLACSLCTADLPSTLVCRIIEALKNVVLETDDSVQVHYPFTAVVHAGLRLHWIAAAKVFQEEMI